MQTTNFKVVTLFYAYFQYSYIGDKFSYHSTPCFCRFLENENGIHNYRHKHHQGIHLQWQQAYKSMLNTIETNYQLVELQITIFIHSFHVPLFQSASMLALLSTY
jgi:hypothetical protein